ncbi:cytochrome P450 [Imleria badia]|nr:cytochrome P450 [Imleria badia]
MAGDLVGLGYATFFVQYGDTLRKHRKFFGRHIGANSGLATFYPAEEAEARRFVLNVSKNPDDLVAYCHRTTASLILKLSHGYNINYDGDPLVEIANRAVHSLSEVTSPGRFLVDFLPILRYLPEWFPGGGFHKDAKRWREMVGEAVNTPYELALEQMAKGDAEPSLLSRSLQEGLTAEDVEILKWTSFTMYLGGTELAPSMLSAFFHAMTMYPEILKKAQTEVDAVVGNERLPTMKDRDALPYVNAVCTELLRWNVLVPLTLHVNSQDIIYEGYLIPKGSWLVPNIWCMLSDPATYPDPDVFNPERFLGKDRQPDPREACFGWGRRTCSGARLVESIIFIYVATALATLDISRCVENGVECVPKYEFKEGTIRRLKPFKCRIVLRSKAEDLLHA